MRIGGGTLLSVRGGLSAALLLGLTFIVVTHTQAGDNHNKLRATDADADSDDWRAERASGKQPASKSRSATRRAALAVRGAARSERSARVAEYLQEPARFREAEHLQEAAHLQEGEGSVLSEAVPRAPTPAGAAVQEFEQDWQPGDVQYDGYPGDVYDGSYGGACDSCGCETCCCPCGPPGRLWVRAEYLLWWTKGLSTPPLVTTSPNGVPREDVGVLGAPFTRVLFGGEDLLKDSRSGGRIRFGLWLDCCNKVGVEADYFALGDESDDFRALSWGGEPLLARPFFNSLTGYEDAELVGLPGVLEGAVGVQTESSYTSAGIRWRQNLCCNDIACAPPCRSPGCGLCYMPSGTSRWDLLVGYRFARLDESVLVTEDLNSLLPGTNTQFSIFDDFDTETEFHGAEIGLAYEFHRCRWSVDLLAKIAFGNNRQRVRINGGTEIINSGFPEAFQGGLLAQRTNIGQYERDKFGVIPEIGVNFGYRLTDHVKLTMGYTFIYWSKVVRPGEQIDREVNTNLLPPEAVPFEGPLRPAFAFHDTDYWAQGLNFGGELRW